MPRLGVCGMGIWSRAGKRMTLARINIASALLAASVALASGITAKAQLPADPKPVGLPPEPKNIGLPPDPKYIGLPPDPKYLRLPTDPEPSPTPTPTPTPTP